MAKKRRKPKSKTGFRPSAAKAQFNAHYKFGRYAEALSVVENFIRQGVKDAVVFSDAAVCAVHLERYETAMGYAAQSLGLDPKNIPALDAMSHSAGALHDWDKVAEFGTRALQVRDETFGNGPLIDLPKADARVAGKNIIAFSLFGGNSKYCETAVLNCVDQPKFYPDWICRFFVDDTVPATIQDRLRQAGGEVVLIDEEMAKWPGPMWRFAAYDDPDAARVIFRDADSVISEREAGAVKEWIAADTGFHAMRDAGTHTELLLAGLWGVKSGALPSMRAMVADFLQKPVQNAHFADQFFLRAYVWPFAKLDILHHDSLFGFMDGRPFPEGPHRDDFHVGYGEGTPYLTVASQNPDGTVLEWYLTAEDQGEICRYRTTVKDSKITVNVPARFALKVQSGEIKFGLDKVEA